MSARVKGLPAPAAAPALVGALAALLALLLVAAALALVISQYRSRQLFAEIELCQQETKTLTAEGARLRADLGHAAQPAMVEAVARRLGMRPINPDKVVMLPPAAAGATAPDPADATAAAGGQP